MAGRQRVIDEDQKLELLQRMEAGETVSKLADEVGVSRQRLYEWRDHLRLRGNLKSRRRGRPARSTAGADGVAQPRSAVDVPAPQEKALNKARRRIRVSEQNSRGSNRRWMTLQWQVSRGDSRWSRIC
ncbi:helix-turn-helix domain-containing protein (plasmid) [Mesorhizobium loti]|nr:helix-turn-helix domain-containing protein [Mesorhizobium loti]